MIEPYKTLFIYPTQYAAIYLDSRDNICVNFSTECTIKNLRRLTYEEYLNLRELEKINLHIPYILSLLNE